MAAIRKMAEISKKNERNAVQACGVNVFYVRQSRERREAYIEDNERVSAKMKQLN